VAAASETPLNSHSGAKKLSRAAVKSRAGRTANEPDQREDVQAQRLDRPVKDAWRLDEVQQREQGDEAGGDDEQPQRLDAGQPLDELIGGVGALALLPDGLAGSADDATRARGGAGFDSWSCHNTFSRVPPATENTGPMSIAGIRPASRGLSPMHRFW
jgi:hypothetical protein